MPLSQQLANEPSCVSEMLIKILSISIGILIAVQAQAAFEDPLDAQSVMMSNESKRPAQSAAKAGKRLVVVGARGLIIISDNNSDTWSQRIAPAQSDLLAVCFPNAKEGWAVGHEGIVLHSKNSGENWEKQFDGRLVKKKFELFYGDKAKAGDLNAKAALDKIARSFTGEPALPFLDVWFEDSLSGFAVGSYGLIIGTKDGGKTWEPWIDRIDNDEMLNLNAIRGIDGDLFIAGERGATFRLNRSTQRFEKVDTGYAGSFFGLVGSKAIILAYGLRGAVYRSENRGKSWEIVPVKSKASITAGGILGDDGGFVLIDVAGEILRADAKGKEFAVKKTNATARLTGVIQLSKTKLLITTTDGVLVESIP